MCFSEPCLKFIKKQSDSLGLLYNCYYPVNPKKPIVILTWIGSDSKLPAILFNSHMDVVPVFEVSHSQYDYQYCYTYTYNNRKLCNMYFV